MHVAALISAAFIALFVGHQVGDHVAQTDWQAKGKAEKTGWVWPMAGHLVTYVICQAVTVNVLQLAGVPIAINAGFAGLAVSVTTHGFIDRRWPVKWLMEHTGSEDFATTTNGPYLVDQTLHHLCLFAAAVTIGVLS